MKNSSGRQMWLSRKRLLSLWVYSLADESRALAFIIEAIYSGHSVEISLIEGNLLVPEGHRRYRLIGEFEPGGIRRVG